MDLLVVKRKHHLDLLGDALQDGVRLHACHEGQDVRLHDAELCGRTLVDGEDVLDRPLGGRDGQIDTVRLHQPLQVQPELVIGALLAARHDAHVRRGRRDRGHKDQRNPQDDFDPPPAAHACLLIRCR